MSEEVKAERQVEQARRERFEKAAREWEALKREIAPFAKTVKEGARTARGEWALTPVQDTRPNRT